MFYLDTQQKVDQSPHKKELQDGTVHIETKPEAIKLKKQGKKKKGRS